VFKRQQINTTSINKKLMSIDITLGPEDNIWVEFQEGTMNVQGKAEMEVHMDGNRLYFGEDGGVLHPYFIPFEDLLTLQDVTLGFSYRPSYHTTLKRKPFGGLEIIRNPNSSTTITADFSKEEYQTINDYVKAWSEQI